MKLEACVDSSSRKYRRAGRELDGYLGLSQRCDSRQDKENNGLFWHKRVGF